MNNSSHIAVTSLAKRWNAVQLGLRLANSYLGLGAIARYYLFWVLIGLCLCLALIPFAILGKLDRFQNVMSQVALFGFVIPMGIMATAILVVKLFSRLLWCGIPETPVATFYAVGAVIGRLAVFVAVGFLWLGSVPFGKVFFLPETLACSGAAWLGLAAEWGFIRTLRRRMRVPKRSLEFENSTASAPNVRPGDKKKRKILTRQIELGNWLKARFPRVHTFASWILFPMAYFAISSLADNGDLHAVPEAILRFLVIAPVMIQVFSMPGAEINELITAVSDASEAARSQSSNFSQTVS